MKTMQLILHLPAVSYSFIFPCEGGKMKNDLAFLIDMHLNLYEHQSTFNPNMPLRDLLYVAQEYQKLVHDATLYASTRVKIPAPRFIVFYNGRETRPGEEILRLSDAYYTPEENPELELKVTVLNINAGNNQALLDNCRTLKEYMQYVDCVRHHVSLPGITLDDAVERAVNECIAKGILADFLRRNKAEAMSISIFEYNEAEEKEKIRKAEYKVGYDAGIADGIQAMIADYIEEGFSDEKIISKLINRFHLTAEEAQNHLTMYKS